MQKQEQQRRELYAFEMVENELVRVTPTRDEYLLARRLASTIMRIVGTKMEYQSQTLGEITYIKSRYKKGYFEKLNFRENTLSYQEMRIAMVCALQIIFCEFPSMTITLDKSSVTWSMPSGKCVSDVILERGSVNPG